MPKQSDVQDYTTRAEWALRERGVYHMPNDVPGLAHAVHEALHRLYPNASLTVEKAPLSDEATFRSTDHLGFKA